jgi:hypothetical protein
MGCREYVRSGKKSMTISSDRKSRPRKREAG